jgi:hypothetical protein
MNENCLECNRLLQESDDALSSHTKKLLRIYESILCTNSANAMLMKREPDVQEAAELSKSTRLAYDDHHATHNEPR